MKQSINLTWDMLLGLIQGRNIHLQYGEDNLLILESPVEGTVLSHEQIQQIEYTAEMRIINMLQKVYENKDQHWSVEVKESDV